MRVNGTHPPAKQTVSSSGGHRVVNGANRERLELGVAVTKERRAIQAPEVFGRS